MRGTAVSSAKGADGTQKGLVGGNSGETRDEKRARGKRVHPVKRHAENSASRRVPPAPVGISRVSPAFSTCPGRGVALASSTYNPPSNELASNDVTSFPLVPIGPVVSTRRYNRRRSLVFYYFTYLSVPASMHAPFLRAPCLSLSLSLSLACNVAALRHCSLQRPRPPTPLELFRRTKI